MRTEAAMAQELTVVEHLDAVIGVLGDIHHCASARRVWLVRFELHDVTLELATELVTQVTLMVQRADAFELFGCAQPGAVRIAQADWLHRKALVVLRQVAPKPGIGRLDAADALQAHGFNHAVL